MTLAAARETDPVATDFGLVVRAVGGGSAAALGNETLVNVAQVAIGAAEAQIVGANASRKSLLICNTGTAAIRVGVTGVTATSGAQIPAGGSIRFNMPNVTTQAIFGIREGAVDSTASGLEGS